MLLAIDPGHEYVKALSSRGERAFFPSLIHPAPQTVDLGGFGRRTVTTIDDVPYVVGEAARRVASPLWSRDKAVDEDTLRLILIAAAELGASGPVRLATDLPLAWFGAQRKAFKEALRGFGGTVVTANGVHSRLWFESIVVLPQGVAAAGPVLDSDKYAPGPYLVVDVGSRTTDYILVHKTKTGELEFDEFAAGSLELGMHAVQSGIADQLTKTYQTHFTAAQVATVDSVIVRGSRIDITSERTQHEQRTARAIVKGLMERLDNQMDQVLGLVAVGGGSRILAPLGEQVIQPPEPQWANAQGCLAALVAKDAFVSGKIAGMP